jgi:cysteine desulfurase / selenocysteine lyase
MSDESRAIDLRKLFPVVERWTYLYNGSIHPCPTPVAEAMTSFLRQWQEGGEAAFATADEAFGKLREKFASLIHAKVENIVITESTTAALNLAAQLLRPHAGQNVVVTDLAFLSTTYSWLVSQLAAPEVRFVESHDGGIRMEDLAALVDDNTAAVILCAVTVGSGFRFNLRDVYAITSRHNAPLIVDGAQALGVVDVNACDPPLDFLAGTASKWLMGPAGVGFLYVADRYLQATPPTVGWYAAANDADWDVRHCELHRDARRFQGGIPNLIGVVGALAGLELLEQIGRDFIERRVRELTTHAIEGLEKMGIDLWTPRADDQRAGIVFLRPPQPAALHAKLKEARIYCGHFLGGIRMDPTFYNTHEEIDKFLAVVRIHMAETIDPGSHE